MNKDKNESNENQNNENDKKNKELSYKEQFYKLVTFTSSVIVIASAGVLITDKICNTQQEDTEIEGQVTSLSNIKKIENETINLKSYLKKGINPKTEFYGEYGGGEYLINNGKYVSYKYTTSNQDKVDIEIRDTNNNNIIFEKTINMKDSKESGITGVEMTRNNEVVVIVSTLDDSEEYTTNVITYNLKGKIISELEIKDSAYLFNIDDANNKTFLLADIKKETLNKVVKYNYENKQLFEKEFGSRILSTYSQNDITIVFTIDFDSKGNNKNLIMHKLDSTGKEIFTKAGDNLTSYSIDGITELSDGNFILEEYDYTDEDNGQILKSIIKVDSQFNQIWKKEINKVVENSYIVEEEDNEYMLLIKEAYHVEEKNKNVKIISINKFDLEGKTLWTKYLGYDDNNKVNLLKNTEIDLDFEPYIYKDKVKINATIFENNQSSGYIEVSIDDNGNIVK